MRYCFFLTQQAGKTGKAKKGAHDNLQPSFSYNRKKKLAYLGAALSKKRSCFLQRDPKGPRVSLSCESKAKPAVYRVFFLTHGHLFNPGGS